MLKVAAVISLVGLLSSSGHALAFEYGVYKPREIKGECPNPPDMAIYMEGDSPINLSIIPKGTAFTVNPKKIVVSRTRMTLRGQSSVFEMEFWKAKSDTFYMKVLSGAENCDGITIKFSK